jgi:hypothetical protein
MVFIVKAVYLLAPLLIISLSIDAAIIPQMIRDPDQQGAIFRRGFQIVGILRAPVAIPDVNNDEYQAIIDGLLMEEGMEERNGGSGQARRFMLRRTAPLVGPKRFSFLDAGNLLVKMMSPNF